MKWDKIKGAFFKDDTGELNLLTVMITILMVMFIYLFIKAEVFGLAISETITGSVVQLISIAFGGYAGFRAVTTGVDLVNQSRIKKKSNENNQEVETNPEKGNPKEVTKGFNKLYHQAKKYIGLKEIVGDSHNPKIMEWIDKLGFKAKYGVDSDEIPWCSTAACGIANECGLTHSGSPRAKSWLKVGVPYKLGDNLPNGNYGIVAVFHRGKKTLNIHEGSGHVEIVGEIKPDGHFYTVGGNVSDQIKEMTQNTKDPMFIEFRLIV